MMKKYTIMSVGIMVLTLQNAVAGGGAMGPLPLPFASQSYPPNPTSHMTPQQKIAVNQTLMNAQNAFQQNHLLCTSRGSCLNRDLTSIANFINKNPRHPAQPILQNIYNVIRHDSRRQKFTTQWVVFQNLSAHRQIEYRSGLRIVPIQPQTVKAAWGTTWITAPAQYNQDDVFTALLQQIDHHHKNCDEYITCLAGDLQIINGLYNRLAVTDPVRLSLTNLAQIIKRISNQKIFNTLVYLKLYNPLNPDWYDTLKKHKAKNIANYGHAEWQQVERSSPATTWRSARITNGTPIGRNEAFRTNMQGLKSNAQDVRSRAQDQKKSIAQWWKENKDLFKGWW